MNRTYKILDNQGRLVLPLGLKEQVEINKGDIVEIYVQGNKIIIEKLDVVKLNDDSKENMENTIISVAKNLDKKSLLMITRKLVDFASKKEE